jgi:short-subunit dehydrogenase
MELKEKYVLITGGTSGIGYELATLFAKDGYHLVIVARSNNELAETSRELEQSCGIKVVTLAKDLFSQQNAFAVYEEVKAMGIEPYILVNNAGHGLYGEFVETDLDRELDIINLNVCSIVILTKLYLRDMIKRGEGKILVTSSIASKSPGPWNSVYHATKAFVQSFTEAVRAEVKDRNITITALLPGMTDTDFFRKAGMENAKSYQEGELADPAEVAKDGYKALMDGDDMVISGMKNKVQVLMNNLTSDEKNAKKMEKQQEPVKKK